MVNDIQTEKAESLGEFLRRHRKEKKCEIKDVIEATRIPANTLNAIEEDNYEELPAEAFARGFYMLYAKFLDLDAKEILARYSKERGEIPKPGKAAPPSKQGRQVNTLAARSSVAPGSALGFALVLLILLIALICWHFSWNPATFLSEKLRNLQEPAATETLLESQTGDIRVTAQDGSKTIPDNQYILSVNFLEATTTTVSIDDGFPEQGAFLGGSVQNWQAQEKISLTLPGDAKVELFFNGSPLKLPEAEGGFITLNLP